MIKTIIHVPLRIRLLSIAVSMLLVGALVGMQMQPGMGGGFGGPGMGQPFGGPGMGAPMGGPGMPGQQPSPDQFAQMAAQIPPEAMAQMAQQGADEVHKALREGGEPAVQKLIDEMKSTMRQTLGTVPPEIENLTVKDLVDMAKEIPPSAPPASVQPAMPAYEPYTPPAPVAREQPTRKTQKAEPLIKVTDAEKKNMLDMLNNLQKHAGLLQSKGIGDSAIAKKIRTIDQLLADLIITSITFQKPDYVTWLAQPSEKRLWGILENLSRKLTEYQPQIVEPLVDYADYLDNPYKLLQIAPNAKKADIKSAYKKLAAQYEPKAKEAALRAAGVSDDDIKNELRLARLNRQQLQNARDLLLDKNLRTGVDKRLGASLERYQYQYDAANNILAELIDTIAQAFFKYDLNNAVEEFLRRRAPEELEKRKAALKNEQLQLDEQKRRSRLQPALSSGRQVREDFRIPTPMYRDSSSSPFNTGYYPGSYGMPSPWDTPQGKSALGSSLDDKKDSGKKDGDKAKDTGSSKSVGERETDEYRKNLAEANKQEPRDVLTILKTIRDDLLRVKGEIDSPLGQRILESGDQARQIEQPEEPQAQQVRQPQAQRQQQAQPRQPQQRRQQPVRPRRRPQRRQQPAQDEPAGADVQQVQQPEQQLNIGQQIQQREQQLRQELNQLQEQQQARQQNLQLQEQDLQLHEQDLQLNRQQAQQLRQELDQVQGQRQAREQDLQLREQDLQLHRQQAQQLRQELNQLQGQQQPVEGIQQPVQPELDQPQVQQREQEQEDNATWD